MNLILNMVTPVKQATIEVDWLEIDTPAGSRVILPHHAPLVATLKPRTTITYQRIDGKIDTIFALSGVVEVDRTKATVIINDAATK